jgi:hypothetical protein
VEGCCFVSHSATKSTPQQHRPYNLISSSSAEQVLNQLDHCDHRDINNEHSRDLADCIASRCFDGSSSVPPPLPLASLPPSAAPFPPTPVDRRGPPAQSCLCTISIGVWDLLQEMPASMSCWTACAQSLITRLAPAESTSTQVCHLRATPQQRTTNATVIDVQTSSRAQC